MTKINCEVRREHRAENSKMIFETTKPTNCRYILVIFELPEIEAGLKFVPFVKIGVKLPKYAENISKFLVKCCFFPIRTFIITFYNHHFIE